MPYSVKPAPMAIIQYCLVNYTKHNQQPAWYGKNEKECIVLFKKTRTFLMMIFMQKPTRTMHYIPVEAPGKSFH